MPQIPSPDDLESCIGCNSPVLVDSDGTTLYRLFHQELVDDLKAVPVSAPASAPGCSPRCGPATPPLSTGIWRCLPAGFRRGCAEKGNRLCHW